MSPFVKTFSVAAVTLVGTGSYLLYQAKQSTRRQWYAEPIPAAHMISPAGGGRHDAFPVVLPPTVTSQSRESRAALTEAFHSRCVEAASLGIPSDAVVQCYGGYLASLNYERRIPNWVLEVIRSDTNDTHRASASPSDDVSDGDDVSRAKSAFYADSSVPDAFRVGPNDYATRGLSRGHLAPAQLHKASQPEMDATFNMNANIVPQDMTLNAVDWLRLEALTQKLSREVTMGGAKKQKNTPKDASPPTTSRGKLFVVTGPAFVPQHVSVERRADGTEIWVPAGVPSPSTVKKHVMQYELAGKGESGVAVPTHMFKVLLAEKPGGRAGATRYEVAAFLLPNRPITAARPLIAYQVPLDLLERTVGLRFFPSLPSASSLPDLCKSHTCEAKGAALFQKYRQVAQLRAASTVPELRRLYTSMSPNQQSDAAVRLEYNQRVAELVAEAIQPID